MKKRIYKSFLACFIFSAIFVSMATANNNHISSDTTWSGTVQISSQVFINDGATLTILPGTHVIFNGNIGISVGGRLLAVGTKNDSITFTAANPSTGWDGILFDGTLSSNDSSKICYSVLSYSIATGSYLHGISGGAIYMNYFDKLKLTNCSFRQNKAISGLGGALYCYVSSPLIMNNVFKGNQAEDGGAIYMRSGLPVISNNLFINNSAAYDGGALCFVYTGSQVVNCTFSGNSAGIEGGAVDIQNASGPVFTNCIFYGDNSPNGKEIAISNNAYGADLYYCILDGGLAGIGGIGGSAMVHNYVNCLNTNPLFKGTGSFPYSLQPSSPCINTGKPDMTGLNIPSLDLAGNPRICPICWARIDQGAFEYQETPSISVSGTIAANTYWCADTVKVTGNITINNGATLTIGKGILVYFMGTYGIKVNGTLLAEGDNNHLIRFESHSTGQRWNGLVFDQVNNSNDTSRLAFCTFRYASTVSRASGGDNGGAIYINNFSKLRISDCQFFSNYAYSQGGAIYLRSANLQIARCIFNNDTSQSGGAISAHNSTLFLNNDHFTNNYVYGGLCVSSDASNGGAVRLDTCTATVVNCTFLHNTAVCSGGGLFAEASSLTLSNDSISYNEAQACTSAGGGGGAYFANTILNATDNYFSHNKASWGGGVLLWGASGNMTQNTITGNMGGVTTCPDGVAGGISFKNNSNIEFRLNRVTNNSSNLRGGMDISYSNPQIIQNLITDNYAGTAGGGITFDHSSPLMMNNIISNNIAESYAGGLWFISSSTPEIKSNIIYGNSQYNLGSNQVYLSDNTCNPNFYYCDIAGGVNGFGGNNNHYTGNYENNIDIDPKFTGSGSNPYQILPESPCFNTGDPTATTGNVGITDLAGNPRIQNRRIDIGGYETSRGVETYGGTALHLTAAVDSVVLDNPGNFLFGSAFTVEFWMRPDSTSSDFHTIIKKGVEWEVNLFYDNYASILTFGTNNMSVFGYYEIPGTLLLNHWNHVAAVFNMAPANPYVTIFLNGQEGTPDQAEAIQHGTLPVVIGSGYLGQIEELRVWQTARTVDQIRADMHLMIPPATSGLVAYHQFNDYSGNLIADISGGNNGTLINMTVPGCFVPSTVPAAGGTSNQQVVAAPGNVAFPGTGFSMNVQMVSMQDTIVVSRLDTLPNTGPPGSNTVYPRYWIMDSYGGASITANMAFVVKQPLIAEDSVEPDLNRLYQRGSNSDSSWAFVKNATSASVAANTIVFNNVSHTGQFLVPAKLFPDRYAGDALSFNGTSQYVKVDPLYYSSPAAITVEFWMFPTAAGSSQSTVVYHGDNGEFMLSFSQNSFDFAVKLSNHTWYNVTGPAPVLNQWQHVCGVWDSSTGMKLYINGTLCQSLSTPSLLLVDPGSGYLPSLGCYDRLNQFYSGKLDEMRIWNVARTTQQIRENMHLTVAGDAPGLIGYWQFNDGSGNFAQDHGGGHIGTLANMSNSNWVASTIPAGGGTSFTSNVSATGQVNFTGTGLTMDFTQKSGADQFVVSCIDTSSNVNPLCQASVMNNKYWVVHQFGTGTFSAGLMFMVKAGLTSSDTIDPSRILLYDRHPTSDSSWVFRSHATSANAGTGQATFKNITSCGQFITGRIRTIYVNRNATGNNSGISWGNAFTSLQSGLDSVASGNRIWVAAGKYKPSSTYDITQPTSRHKHFRMKGNAAIYGGFAGNEPVTFDLSARDLVANETILSGDLNDNGKDENDCYHVFYHPLGLGLTNTAVLDGFTIQGSNGDGSPPFDIGGGMLNISNSPSVQNCIFNHNYSLNGGGMANLTISSPTVTNCLFVDNSSTPGGGGMYNSGQGSPLMINCTFTNNTALTGGGIENTGNCTPVFKNCIVWGNVASASSHPGNQFYIDQGTTTLNYSCYASDAGDVYLTGGGVLMATNHNITTNPLFINAASEDCRLYGTSPCVNTGNNPYNPELIDIRGKARIQDTTIDMGAYEWTVGTDPQAPLFTWTGAISTDWNTAGNWNSNIVPGTQDDVYIPLTTNKPLVNNMPGNPAQCRNLSIVADAVLTVPPGKVIIINGTVTIAP